MAQLRLSREAALSGVAAFLDEVVAARATWKTKDDAAVSAALSQHDVILDRQAAEVAQALALLGTALLPKIDGGGALLEEQITELNQALENCGQKSEVIPSKLASAKPGDKLFNGLVQKVKKVLSQGEDAWRSKLRTSKEQELRDGGKDVALDAQRQAVSAEYEEVFFQITCVHAQALGQSDHQPIYHTLQLTDESTLALMSWNTLEFPVIEGDARQVPPNAVLDGINPVCDAQLKILERKGADQKAFLVKAMGLRPVVEMHASVVLEEVQHALLERQVNSVLLQEVSQDMQARLSKQATASGWTAHFSRGNSDPGKCDAITCVVSRQPFDEVGEFVQQSEGTKVRHFAMARQGQIWLASCHAPGEVLTKQQVKDGVPSHGNAVISTRIYHKIAAQIFKGDGVQVLVAGGDWNTDVRVLHRNLVSDPPTCCGAVQLHAPDTATCLDVEWPIDGVLVSHDL